MRRLVLNLVAAAATRASRLTAQQPSPPTVGRMVDELSFAGTFASPAALEARETGKPVQATPPSIDAEIASIERLMRTDRAEYERSGAADRLLKLYEAKAADLDVVDQRVNAGEEWRASPTGFPEPIGNDF